MEEYRIYWQIYYDDTTTIRPADMQCQNNICYTKCSSIEVYKYYVVTTYAEYLTI